MLRFLQHECGQGVRLKRNKDSQRNKCVVENIGSEDGHGSVCSDSESCSKANTPTRGCVVGDAAETICQGQCDELRTAEVSVGGLLNFITASRSKWLQDAPTPAKRKSSHRVVSDFKTPRRQASQEPIQMALTPPALQRSHSVRANGHPLCSLEAGTSMKAALSETAECVKDVELSSPQGFAELLVHRKAVFCDDRQAEEPLDLGIDAPGAGDATAALASYRLQAAAVSEVCPTVDDQEAAVVSEVCRTVEQQEVAKRLAKVHMESNGEACAPLPSVPQAMGKEGAELPAADSYLEGTDDATVSPPSSPREVESPNSRLQRGYAALQEAQLLHREIFKEVKDLENAALTEDYAKAEADKMSDSDYEVVEESEDAAESDFEALSYESDDGIQSNSEHEVDNADFDDQDAAKKLPVAGRRPQTTGHSRFKMPRLEECSTVRKVGGLTRMGSIASRSQAHALPPSTRACTADGDRERRRMVSHLLKPFSRKKPSWQKGTRRQQSGTTHSFFRDEKNGCRKQTAAHMHAEVKPFAAISEHLQKKKRSQPAAGSDRSSSSSIYSSKMRTGLLKRRCLPETENENSDSDYPSTQAILDSIPSPELMQLARSIDARAAAVDT